MTAGHFALSYLRWRWPHFSRWSSLVVLVVSVRSVHYAYILLSYETKTSHCNCRAFFLKGYARTKKRRKRGKSHNYTLHKIPDRETMLVPENLKETMDVSFEFISPAQKLR